MHKTILTILGTALIAGATVQFAAAAERHHTKKAVRVTAPAERGKANAAVEAVVAEALGVAAQCVRVVTGTTSPRKVVEITGLSEAEVYHRLRMP